MQVPPPCTHPLHMHPTNFPTSHRRSVPARDTCLLGGFWSRWDWVPALMTPFFLLFCSQAALSPCHSPQASHETDVLRQPLGSHMLQFDVFRLTHGHPGRSVFPLFTTSAAREHCPTLIVQPEGTTTTRGLLCTENPLTIFSAIF